MNNIETKFTIIGAAVAGLLGSIYYFNKKKTNHLSNRLYIDDDPIIIKSRALTKKRKEDYYQEALDRKEAIKEMISLLSVSNLDSDNILLYKQLLKKRDEQMLQETLQAALKRRHLKNKEAPKNNGH